MKNNKRSKISKLISVVMLVALVATLFSACAVSTVDYFTGEMPSVEEVVGYSVDEVSYSVADVSYETDGTTSFTSTATESIQTLEYASSGETESVVKLASTAWDGTIDTSWYTANISATSYEISTAAQLAGLAQIVNGTASEITADTFSGKTITLAADIDLASIEWTPIGTKSNMFKGTFDGDGHAISNLCITSTLNQYVGLFGYIYYGTIENVGVSSGSISITGSTSIIYVGGIAGYISESIITNCYNEGTVTGSSSNKIHVGGIAGYIYGSTITNCYNKGDVTNATTTGSSFYNNCVGGIVGYSTLTSTDTGSTIINCYNTGIVSGTSTKRPVYAGGITGLSENSCIVENSYNTGNVQAESTSSSAYAGGVSGISYNIITNCYNTGSISGTSNSSSAYVGGIAGSNGSNGTITNCFAHDYVTVNGTALSTIATLVGKESGSGTTAYVATALASGGKVTSGNSYYLSGNYSGNLSIPASGTVNLNLNGYTITATSGSAITVGSSATLNLFDSQGYGVRTSGGNSSSSPSTNKYGTGGLITGGSTSNGGGVYVNDSATFNMYGGTIAGNTASTGSGGGVYINASSLETTFNMYGGKITSNTAYLYGGGVYINTSSGSGIFNMSGGEIYGNTATNSDKTIRGGGGVYLTGSATMNMTGGEIYSNTVSNSGYGGGVYVTGTLNMTGGEIYSNSATYGGGISTHTADTTTNSITIFGGEVYSNTATYGGGIYSLGTLALSNSAIISGNSATNGGGIYVASGTATMTKAYITDNTASSNGGGVYMAAGAYSLNSTTNYIYDNTATSGGGIYVAGGDLTMSYGNIYNNTATNGGGVYVIGSSSKFTMSNGSIYSNTASSAGGGVYIRNESGSTGTDGYVATFYMTGGTIKDNTVTSSEYGGGGVFVGGVANFEMSGGTISGNVSNSTSRGGGGVFVGAGSFTMSGGTISNNEVLTSGGGIYLESGTLTMDGGTISVNTAITSGGGVYIGGSFNISGSVAISGNTLNDTNKTTENVYLATGKTITVSDALTGGGIGVTMQSTTGEFATGVGDYNSYFSSDNGDYVVLSSGSESSYKYSIGVECPVAVSDINIYANGEAILIANGGTDKTSKIYFGFIQGKTNYEDPESYQYCFGDTSFTITEGYVNAAAIDISSYYIFGGGTTALESDTRVTITGGTVANIYGGNSTETLTGNTNVLVTGGSVQYVFGAGSSGALVGNAKITMTGGTAAKNMYGGGSQNGATVSGDISVAISGGTLSAGVFAGGNNTGTNVAGNTAITISGTASVASSVYGGGNSSDVSKGTSVTINGGTISGAAYGGGNSGIVSQDASVTITGGTVNTSVYGGGVTGAVTGNTSVTITGGTIIGSVYGGGNKGIVSQDASVTITGGTITGSVFGGGSSGNVSEGTSVTIKGGTIGSAYSGGSSSGGGTVTGTKTLAIDLESDLTFSKFLGTSTVGEGITSFDANSKTITYTGTAKSTIAYFDSECVNSVGAIYNNDAGNGTVSAVSVDSAKSAFAKGTQTTDNYHIDDYSLFATNAIEDGETGGEANGYITFAIPFANATVTMNSSSTTYTGKAISMPTVSTSSSKITYTSSGKNEPETTITAYSASTWVDISGASSTSIINADTYYNTLTYNGAGEFYGTLAATYTVSNATITVTATQSSPIYNGTAQTPTAITAGNITTEGSQTASVQYGTVSGTYDDSMPTFTDAGTHTVYYKVTAANHNDLSGSFTFTIAKATASVTTAPTANDNLIYTSAAQNLVTAGAVSAGTLEYSLNNTEYSTNIPTGTGAQSYTVYYRVNGGTNYKDVDAQSVTVTIAKVAVTVPTAVSGLTYNGSSQTGVAATTDKIASSDSTLFYSLSGNTETNAGNHTATATLGDTTNYEWVLEGGNSSAAQSISWSIAKLDIKDATITLGTSLTYTGQQQTQTVSSVAVGGITLSTTDYGVSDNKGTTVSADNYTLTVTAADNTNFTGSATTSWNIAKASNSITAITLPDGWTYGETGSAAKVTATFGTATIYYNTVSGESDSGWSTSTPTNAGTYYVKAVVEETTNYACATLVSGSTFAITAKELSASVSSSSGGTFGSVTVPTFTIGGTDDSEILNSNDYIITWTYTDMSSTVVWECISSDGGSTWDFGEYEVSITEPDFSHAGTYQYSIDATSSGNYSTSGQTGTVSVARQTVTVPTAATGLIYKGEVQTGVSSAGTSVYTVSDGTATNANSYTATATLLNTNNYIWDLATDSIDDQKINWSIAQKTITVTAGSETPTKVYDSTTSIPDNAGLSYAINNGVSGENITLTLGTAVYNSANVSEANKITMTYQLASSTDNSVNANYSLASGTFEYTAKITKADYVMTDVTFADMNSTYNGTTQNIAVGGTLPTGLDGVAVTVSYSDGSEDVVADKEITATFATTSGNYNTPAAKTAKLTIEQKDASVTVATNDTEITYGDEVPTHTISIDGFVASDEIQTSDFSATTGYEQYSNVGNYDFTITNADSTYTNYKITYKDSTDASYTGGDFTVGTYAITVTADSDNKTYDGNAFTDSGFTYTTLFADFSVEVAMTSTSTITNYADNAKDNNVIDTVAITYGGGDVTSNFAITKVAGTLAISQKEVGVSGLSAEGKTYNGTNNVVVTYSTSGILDADSDVSVSKVASFDAVNAGDQNVSVTYSITGDTNRNYVLATGSTTGSTKATISKKEVSLTWTTLSADDLVYNNTDKVVSATVGDIISGDSTVTVTAYSTTGEIKNVSDAVFYYEATTLSDSNYKLPTAAKSAEYTITKADYDMDGVTFVDTKSTYDGTTQNIAVGGTLPTGLDGVQVTVSYSDGSEDVVADKEITATFATTSGNYNTPAAKTAKLTIEQKDASVTVATNDTEITYGDEVPTHTISIDGFVASDEIQTSDFSATTGYEQYSNVGNYDFTITNADSTYTNYKITYKDSTDASYTGGDFTVVNADLVVTVAASQSTIYNSESQSATAPTATSINNQTVAVTYASETDGAGTYSLSDIPVYESADTYTIKYQITADNHNTVTGSITYVINKAKVTLTANDGTMVYGKTPADNYGYTQTGTIYDSELGEILAVTDETSASVYITYITYTANNNYDVTLVKGNFKITNATIVYDGAFSDSSQTYANTEYGITLDSTKIEIVNGLDFVIKYGLTEGNYITETMPTITNVAESGEVIYWQITADNHDAITGSNEIEVVQRELSATWDYIDAFTYDGTEKTVAITAGNIASGEDQADLSITYENEAKTTHGEYTAVATIGNGNYVWANSGDAEIEWTINQKSLADSEIIESVATGLVYDGDSQDNELTITYNLETDLTLDLSTDYTVTWTYQTFANKTAVAYTDTTFKNAGTYVATITAAQNGNYKNSTSVTFVVAQNDLKATVELPSDTAYNSTEDPSITFGNTVSASDYVLTWKFVALTETETVKNWESSTSESWNFDNAGTYSYVITTVSSGNFTDEKADSTLSGEYYVARATVELPIADTTLIYNGVSQTGVEVLKAVEGLYTVANGVETNVKVDGNYTAVATLADKNNYEWNLATNSIENQTITWNIAPKVIEFTDVVQEIYYGETTYGENIDILTETVDGETGETVTVKYTTSAGNADGFYDVANYDFATVTITKVSNGQALATNYAVSIGTGETNGTDKLVVSAKSLNDDDISVTVGTGDEYDATAYAHNLTIKYEADGKTLTLVRNTDYTLAWTYYPYDENGEISATGTEYETSSDPAFINAGEYVATIVGIGNFDETYSTEVSFVITQKELTLAMVTDLSSSDWNGSSLTPTFDVVDSAANIAVDDYALTYTFTDNSVEATAAYKGKFVPSGANQTAFVQVGTYAITISADGVAKSNYTGYVVEEFGILDATAPSVVLSSAFDVDKNDVLDSDLFTTWQGATILGFTITDNSGFVSTKIEVGGNTITIVENVMTQMVTADDTTIAFDEDGNIISIVKYGETESLDDTTDADEWATYKAIADLVSVTAITQTGEQTTDGTNGVIVKYNFNSTGIDDLSISATDNTATADSTSNKTATIDCDIDGDGVYQAVSVVTMNIETEIDAFNDLYDAYKTSDLVSDLTAAENYYNNLSVVKQSRISGTEYVEDSVVGSNALSDGCYDNLSSLIAGKITTIIQDAIDAAIKTPSEANFASAFSIYATYAENDKVIGDDDETYSSIVAGAMSEVVAGQEYTYAEAFADIEAVSSVASLYASEPSNYTRLSTIVSAYEALTEDQQAIAGDYEITIDGVAEKLSDLYSTYAEYKTNIDEFTEKVNKISSVSAANYDAVQALVDVYTDKDDSENALSEAEQALLASATNTKLAEWEAIIAKIEAIEGLISAEDSSGNIILTSEITDSNYAEYVSALISAQNAYEALSASEKALMGSDFVSKLNDAETALGMYLSDAADAAEAVTFQKAILSAISSNPTISDIEKIYAEYAVLDIYVVEYIDDDIKSQLATYNTAVSNISEITVAISTEDEEASLAKILESLQNGDSALTDYTTADLQAIKNAIPSEETQAELIENSYGDVIDQIEDLLLRLSKVEDAIDNLDNYTSTVSSSGTGLDDFIISTGTPTKTDYIYIGYIEDARIALEMLSDEETDLLENKVFTDDEIAKVLSTIYDEDFNQTYDSIDSEGAIEALEDLGYIVLKDDEGEVTSVSMTGAQYINTQYQGLLEYYDYIDWTIENVSSVSEDEEDGEYVAVYGLATKVDTDGVTDIVEATSVKVYVEAEKVTDVVIDEVEDGHEVALTYDIKLYAQVTVGDAVNDPEQIQPIDDTPVVVTIPLSGINEVGNIKLYHKKDTGDVTEITDLIFSKVNDIWYATFETDSFSEFVVTNIIPVVETTTSTSSSSSSVALDQSAPEIEADGSELTITDKNLVSVYINGEKYEVDGDTFEIDLAEFGDGEYEIVAWDRYGRTTTQIFTISGEDVEAGEQVEAETETETETPSATTTPAETEDASSSSFPWWILIAAVAICGGVGYVIYKKKK